MKKNHNRMDPTIITEPQLPFAKIVPISNNIYSKLSNQHEQLMLHFQVRILKEKFSFLDENKEKTNENIFSI